MRFHSDPNSFVGPSGGTEAIATNRTSDLFAPEELAHLRKVDREPFDSASEAEVVVLFDRARG